VSNHQSMYDIIAMIWFFADFIVNLSVRRSWKGIPSVSLFTSWRFSSYWSKDPKQAIPLLKLAEYIEIQSFSIFPEGTRSKTGVPKAFSQTGLKILCKNAPSAYVVPVSINNSWKIVKYGFPLGLKSLPL
jgi:1-acyl-sn-glycerol-3-phosphate acyltransferase